MLQQLTSSSSYGTTIPIPDVVQNASGNTRALYEMDNTSGNSNICTWLMFADIICSSHL